MTRMTLPESGVSLIRAWSAVSLSRSLEAVIWPECLLSPSDALTVSACARIESATPSSHSDAANGRVCLISACSRGVNKCNVRWRVWSASTVSLTLSPLPRGVPLPLNLRPKRPMLARRQRMAWRERRGWVCSLREIGRPRLLQRRCDESRDSTGGLRKMREPESSNEESSRHAQAH